MDDDSKNLSTESYKGVRDFYPNDFYAHTRLFKTMGRVAKSYGYVEYNASILEPTELYAKKTNEEIISKQTYTFEDRGGRSVTLRPEMTPSVARMVAHKRRELTFPLRWYSIGNMYRYERPQRGRLREHTQLNVDIFGIAGVEAEFEMISLVADLMHAFGATDEDFVIRINSRKLLNAILRDHYALDQEKVRSLLQILDQKNKVKPGEFEEKLQTILSDKTEEFLRFLNGANLETCTQELPEIVRDMEGVKELDNLLKMLEESGIHCVTFDPSLARGFDYYTGVVFEVFDTNPKNSRALFGGGRYDRLVEMFESEQVPAVGFAMGDVRIQDFLDVRGLLPNYKASADLFICTTDPKHSGDANTLARTLRKGGLNVEVDITHKRVGDQVRIANKNEVPFVLCIGDEEVKSKEYTVKELSTSTETKLKEDKVIEFIKANT